MMDIALASTLGAMLGYAFGSVPFGLLFTRVAGLGDIRAIGSGNIGATNVLRSGRYLPALLTLLADAGKGWLAVALAQTIDPVAGYAAASGALLGHIFPLWLGFRGGKGVAVYIGVLCGLSVQGGIVFCALWIVCALMFRISSLAALSACIGLPLWLLIYDDSAVWLVSLVLSLVVFWAHRDNMKRLRRGEEPRIGA